MSKALRDVVVVDFTTEMWSGLAAAMLGDFGADVIRIEALGEPRRDPNRDGAHPKEAFDAEAELIHRNKRSLGIDLSTDDGREILSALIAKADVFLTDLPFDELEARGLGAEALAGLRSDLVIARGSGFGPQGPDRDLPALDELAASRAGIMPSLPQPGEPPVYTGTGQMFTTLHLALGIVTALHHRAESGEGQVVDASLFGSNLFAISLTLDAYLAMKDDQLSRAASRLDAANPMSGIGYQASDDRWVTLTMPDTDRWWPVFSEIMGMDVEDDRFDTHDKRCETNRLEMIHVLEEIFATQPSSHWRERFNEKKISADVIEKYDYPASDSEAVANRYVLNLDHPGYGEIQTLGFPLYMSGTPARLSRMAPARGQHSAELLQEILGWDDARIEDLEARKVVSA